MATIESIQRLKYLIEMRRSIKKNDPKAMVAALGNYQEWYVGRHEVKTSDFARTTVAKFTNSLRGK
mgnify:CR=1 FL=1